MKADDGGFYMDKWLKSLKGRPVSFIQEPEKGRLSLLIRLVQDFADLDLRFQEVLDERDALAEKLTQAKEEFATLKKQNDLVCDALHRTTVERLRRL